MNDLLRKKIQLYKRNIKFLAHFLNAEGLLEPLGTMLSRSTIFSKGGHNATISSSAESFIFYIYIYFGLVDGWDY